MHDKNTVDIELVFLLYSETQQATFGMGQENELFFNSLDLAIHIFSKIKLDLK